MVTPSAPAQPSFSRTRSQAARRSSGVKSAGPVVGMGVQSILPVLEAGVKG